MLAVESEARAKEVVAWRKQQDLQVSTSLGLGSDTIVKYFQLKNV